MDVYFVVIQCPNTGKATRTGVEISDITSFKLVGLLPEECQCQHCHERHVWRQQDAWIERQQASRVHVRGAGPRHDPSS
jgi:hypothetical protein